MRIILVYGLSTMVSLLLATNADARSMTVGHPQRDAGFAAQTPTPVTGMLLDCGANCMGAYQPNMQYLRAITSHGTNYARAVETDTPKLEMQHNTRYMEGYSAAKSNFQVSKQQDVQSAKATLDTDMSGWRDFTSKYTPAAPSSELTPGSAVHPDGSIGAVSGGAEPPGGFGRYPLRGEYNMGR